MGREVACLAHSLRMAANIPEREPSTVIAGDTAKWLLSFGDYSIADGWSLTYTLVSRDSKKVTVTATNSNGSFLSTISAAVSSNMAPGTWSYQGRVSNATESYTIRSGTFELEDNFSAVASVLDNRTHARKMLDLIEAQLEGRVVDGIESHSIGGVPINMIPFERLRVVRDQYKSEALREENAEKIRRGIGGSSNLYVRFR